MADKRLLRLLALCRSFVNRDLEKWRESDGAHSQCNAFQSDHNEP
jgi:hypothetical protein